MRRGYTAERYFEICDTLRREVAGIEIASDFIVGFPGEGPEDFDRTVDLMERVRFQNSFVFKYSPRPGTDAAALADDVPEEEKKRRHQALLEVQERHSLEKNRARIGQRMEVLVEGPSKRDPRRQTGRTDTHQIVNFEAGRDLRGRFVQVDITGATALSLAGALPGLSGPPSDRRAEGS
jgi:tRNA-2-methylthio-N6-dimethylallyladenosine synthase